MERKQVEISFFWQKSIRKLLSLRGVITLLLILSMINASGANSSRNELVTLVFKDVAIKKVIESIEKQTSFDFFYSKEDVDDTQRVSINLVDEKLTSAVDALFKDKYQVKYDGKIIMISQKAPKPQDDKDIKLVVSGKVVDENNNGMPGVSVVLAGTTIGKATNVVGRYSIPAKKGDVLKFSFVGYKPQVILVKGDNKINVKMIPEVEDLEEVAVVAFGTQKKESVVSSITSVKADNLKVANSDLTSSFAGNVSGVIGWQTGGLPGALTEDELNTQFYIRGITSTQENSNRDPLILLDGVEISKLDLARIDPQDIASFNVMKDASATAMYGARGANGVIFVKTKKGEAGNVYSTFRYERIYSMPTSQIDVVDPITYMRLYNEASAGRNPDILPKYSSERIKRTASGNFPDWVYPAVDWYDKLFKDITVNNHYALNVRGGTEKIQYFASATYNDDKGMLKTERLHQFDSNIQNKQLTFRVNLNVNLNETAKLVMNSFTTYDKNHGPLTNVRQAYGLAFSVSPVDFAPVYPADNKYNWPHVRFGGSEVDNLNPYAEIQKGYLERKRYSTTNRFEYIQNLNSFCKGLEVRMSASLQKTGFYSVGYKTNPALYKLEKYDQVNNTHVLRALNENSANRILDVDGRNAVTVAQTSLEYQLKTLHTAAWGNHETSFISVLALQEKDNNFPFTFQGSLPQRNMGLSMRGSYGYKGRYYIESSFGYNGSERFSKENKFGFFPSFGAAWIASKENFIQNISWIDFLKFRLSYGKVGNDGVTNAVRFVYLENLKIDSGVNIDNRGGIGNVVKIVNYANPKTTWEISEQFNLGTEIKMFKDFFTMNIDAYQLTRHNIFGYRSTIPETFGLHSPPLDNVAKVRARGFDLEAKIQHAFNSKFYFILNGTLTYSRAEILEIEEPANTREWQRREGREVGQQYGYIAEGLFQDQAEIDSAPLQSGEVMPGDIRYRDIDGNGTIDINDKVAIGNPTTPRLIYGFNGFVHYKGFEFGMAFQGLGQRSIWIDPAKVSPFDGNRALLSAFAKDHWTTENHAANPLWPRLSVKNITEHNKEEKELSTYFMRDGSFLRCRNIELAYLLNNKFTEKLKLKNLRFYIRANNPFIISNFKLWDVELGRNGFNYPIQKSYTCGLSLSF